MRGRGAEAEREQKPLRKKWVQHPICRVHFETARSKPSLSSRNGRSARSAPRPLRVCVNIPTVTERECQTPPASAPQPPRACVNVALGLISMIWVYTGFPWSSKSGGVWVADFQCLIPVISTQLSSNTASPCCPGLHHSSTHREVHQGLAHSGVWVKFDGNVTLQSKSKQTDHFKILHIMTNWTSVAWTKICTNLTAIIAAYCSLLHWVFMVKKSLVKQVPGYVPWVQFPK